jgi:hypothetical protein
MDSGVAYLLRLNNAPSQPGGPLAPRVDDDELRAAEEALRARHLARLRNREHLDMLQRLRDGEALPDHEPFEEEEEPAPAQQQQQQQQQSLWQSSCVLS